MTTRTLSPHAARALRRTHARAQRRTRKHGAPLVVWDGTGMPFDPHGLAVRAWLEANRISGAGVPVGSTITLWKGRIRYTAMLRNSRGNFQLDPTGTRPLTRLRTAPLRVPFLPEDARPGRPAGSPACR